MKLCSKCQITKSLNSFSKDKAKQDGLASHCRTCKNATVAKWKVNNKQAWYDSARNAALKNKFGMSITSYDAMLAEQDGVCAICKKAPGDQKFRFAVDHWHSTNDVRGILCNHCNRGLGAFYDNPDILTAAIIYLEERGYG